MRDVAGFQQASLLLAAVLQTLTPDRAEDEVANDTASNPDHHALMAKDKELAGKLEGSELANGIEAIARFAWGVLLDLRGPANFRG